MHYSIIGIGVRVDGLKNGIALNGKIGTTQSFDAGTERYYSQGLESGHIVTHRLLARITV